MTDLIHERPRGDASSRTTAFVPPLDAKTGQKRVYGYILILFLVAFSLLLWSSLASRRTTERMRSELRGNADALQTALTRNTELEQQLETLQERTDALEQTLAARKRAMEQERDHSAARELLWRLEYHYARGEYERCRAVCAELAPLRGALQTEVDAGEPSELARYEEISALVG